MTPQKSGARGDAAAKHGLGRHMAYNLNGYNVINGTSGNDVLNGTNQRDAIYGNSGIDRLFGGRGADVLFGGVGGGDTFWYSVDATWAANYSAFNAGDPSAAGSGALINLSGFSTCHDVFVGTGLNNTLEMGDGRRALFLDDSLSPGVSNIRLVNIQTIKLGTGGQLIDLTSSTASYGDVTIIGNTGDDIIWSNAGNDALHGGDGNDYIWGGSGNDQIFGGTGNDQLLGGTGNDVLDGGVGDDSLTGGAGDDTYIIDGTTDLIVEAAQGGIDTVHVAFNYTLGTHLENLVLLGAAALSGTGNAAINTITGNAGDNQLDGAAGADTLIGGAGNDTYTVDNVGDVNVELAGEGTDLVLSSVTHTLSANVENLTLTDVSNTSGTGNVLNNTIIGNVGQNTLNGGDGDDWLDGGANVDTMMGGSGNDTFVVDHANDITIELAGQGTDLVRASVTHTLQGNVENLTLTGASHFDGTGNALNNIILGNDGNNTLSGLDGDDRIDGGNGNDTLVGGNGRDTLNGGFGSDTLNGGEGNDGLNGGADADWLYGGNGDDGLFGGGAFDFLFGDAGNDTIYGDGGNDTISGGAGSDRLAGGQLQNGFSVGNDTFVWARADVINGAGVSQGFDRVLDFQSGDRLDFTSLGLGGNLSVLQFTSTAAGTIVSADFGAGFVNVVQLDNVQGITAASLQLSGGLLI